MFVFVVDEIPEGGLEITHEMPPEWVDELLPPQYHRGDRPMVITLTVNRRGRTVMARGHFRGALRFLCSRCAAEACLELDSKFLHIFVARAHRFALPEGSDDLLEAEYTFYEGRTVDVEPVAAEEFVMSLRWFPLCREDCKGLCQQCGQNLNEASCQCKADAVDPRWAALKTIKLTR